MTLFLLSYRIQDVCLIFALISLVLSFFSTYAFQVSCLSKLFAFKSFCTLHCITFQYCLYVIFGWSDWTAVWPSPSYNYHQHNIFHPDYHVAQLVAKWAMGTSTGAHMARWSDLAVCYPETLWVSPIICWEVLKLKLFEIVSVIMTFISFAVAVLYYYHYKRSMLRISDPRFYEDFRWMRHHHDGPWDPNLRYLCYIFSTLTLTTEI